MDTSIKFEEAAVSDVLMVKSAADSMEEIGQHQDEFRDNFDTQSMDKEPDNYFKPNAIEKHIFTLVYTMVKENDLPYLMVLLLMIIEDMQLFTYSWREAQVNSRVLRWIFNPFLIFVESATFASHIISWIIIAIIVATIIYCSVSLSAGQIRFTPALHTLRFLTIVVSTVLFIPIFVTFINPTTCVNGRPLGYPNMHCGSSDHTVILISAIVGAVLVTAYSMIMSLLFFNSEMSSKVGKRDGRIDFFYVCVRVILVVIETKLSVFTSSIVNTVFLGILALIFLFEQPFYNGVLNNIRGAFFSSAFFLSLANLIYTGTNANAPVLMIVIGLCIILLASIVTFFANEWYIQWQRKSILYNLKRFDSYMGENMNKKDNISKMKELRQSYLELIYDTAHDVTKRKAVIEKVRVFPAPQFVDIAVRFIQNSYMDKDALTLANRLLEVGIVQFSRSGSVYLAYLGYIKAFFPFLKGQERTHLSIMLRKCKLAFDQRFLVYLQQQSIRQSNHMGLFDEDDADFSYTSYVEYQSMENSAKQYHVQTLLELRDFWNSLRSDANDYVLSARLTKISNFANTTNRLYQKLIHRFPNSRNAFLLYARFHSFVSADIEQASLYRSMGDDLESISYRQAGGDGTPSQSGADDDMDRKSANSKGNSEGSRQSKLVRQKRSLLTMRLQIPIAAFLRQTSIAACAFIALLIAAIVFSKIAIDNTSRSLDNLNDAMVGRRMLHKIYSDTRRAAYAAELGDSANFVSYMTSLNDSRAMWVASVHSRLNRLVGSDIQNTIFLWDGSQKQYQVTQMNAYGASDRLITSMNYILNFNSAQYAQNQPQYSSRSITSNSVYFRYIYDNLDNIYDLFDQDCMVVAETYGNGVTTSIAIVATIFGALFFLLLVAGLGVPHHYLSRCLKTQDQVLGLFRKIPRNLAQKFLTDVEEEIETISGDNEHLVAKSLADANKNISVTIRWTLRWEYLVLCLLMLCAIPVMFYFVYVHLSTTQYVPLVFSYSNVRRTDLPQRIYSFGQEIVVSDNTTWIKPMAIAKMHESINEMERLHTYVNRNLEAFLADGIGLLFRVLRTGDCWLKTVDDCKAAAIPAVGYTFDLMTSGVDTQIIRFISEGRLWIAESNYTSLDNPRLRLMEAMARDLGGVLSNVVRNGLLEIVSKSISSTTLILFLVMGITMGLSILAYYFGFWLTSRQFSSNNDQLVSLLYFIPHSERLKLQDLNAFVESGGAILN